MAAALWLGMACGIGARAQGREVLLGDLGADMEGVNDREKVKCSGRAPTRKS